MEKRYFEKTIGGIFRDAKNNILAYVGGDSGNGIVFRDDEAKGDEICYIPEFGFDEVDEDDSGENTMTEENARIYGYTFSQLMHLVNDELKYINIKVSDSRLDEITRDVLRELEWQFPEVYLKSADLIV